MLLCYFCYTGLLDTQSITFETISASHSLCVICDFAPWTKDNTSCVVFIHLLETSYSSSKVAYKNSTGKGRACFPDLPTDKQYVVNITVVDGLYNQTLHSMNVSINFTSSQYVIVLYHRVQEIIFLFCLCRC